MPGSVSKTSVGSTSSSLPQAPVEETGGKKGAAETSQTQKPETPSTSAEQLKGAKQHAADKASDAKLQAQAKLPQETSREQQTKALTEAAKKSGLEESELKKLQGHLGKLDDKAFKQESKFLKQHVLNSPNADRALRTYNSLHDLQSKGKNAERLTNDHIHTLTRGVADPRAKSFTRGQEGVLGQDAAEKAAKALIGMPKKDYEAINKSLKTAGKNEVFGGSAQMEKALILKAAAARSDQLVNPSVKDRLQLWSGKNSSAMQDITKFAKEIHGSQRSTMATESTSIDPYMGNKALQQRWNDSCGPTTAQGIKAELDPIYAKKLHEEFIHSTKRSGDIGKEQKTVLEKHGGVAVKRDAAGGVGTTLDSVLNSEVKKYTGVNYTANYVGNTPAARGAALDSAADKLKKGVDVPIRCGWPPPGGGHFMYLTDVRGSGDNQKFLLTDPWEGKTVWLTRQQLASGNTPFPAGTGALTHTY
jgi:hypothetical protein